MTHDVIGHRLCRHPPKSSFFFGHDLRCSFGPSRPSQDPIPLNSAVVVRVWPRPFSVWEDNPEDPEVRRGSGADLTVFFGAFPRRKTGDRIRRDPGPGTEAKPGRRSGRLVLRAPEEVRPCRGTSAPQDRSVYSCRWLLEKYLAYRVANRVDGHEELQSAKVSDQSSLLSGEAIDGYFLLDVNDTRAQDSWMMVVQVSEKEGRQDQPALEPGKPARISSNRPLPLFGIFLDCKLIHWATAWYPINGRGILYCMIQRWDRATLEHQAH